MKNICILFGLFLLQHITFAQKQDKTKSELQAVILKLQTAAKENNIPALCDLIVYDGEDKKRAWKRSLDATIKADAFIAEDWKTEIDEVFKDCTDISFSEVKKEKESEGIWYILHVTCKEKPPVGFAFLKINGKYLLGDID